MNALERFQLKGKVILLTGRGRHLWARTHGGPGLHRGHGDHRFAQPGSR